MSLPASNTVARLTDFIGLQDDLTALLMCDARLHQQYMVQERKLMMDAALQISAIWQAGRNGCFGSGIIIEIPRPRVTSPGAPGPVYDLDLGFVVLEERNLNMTPGTGTFLLAEQTVQIIHDILHLYALDDYGTLQARTIEPATDWISDADGIWALRAKLFLKNPRRQTPQVGQIQISVSGGAATLACANNPTAQIFFTTDKSFPANDPAVSPQTQLYTQPFPVNSGDCLRAAAYQDQYIQSAVAKLTVP